MDTLLYSRYRRENGTSDPLAWEFASGVTGWEHAPVPANLGKRIVEGFLGRTCRATELA